MTATGPGGTANDRVTTTDIPANPPAAINISTTSNIIKSGDSNTRESTVSASISSDIARVNQGVQDISHNSTQLNTKAGELGQLAVQLQQIVGRFKV